MKRLIPLLVVSALLLFAPATDESTYAQSAGQCQVVVMIDEPVYRPDSPSIGDAWTLTMTLSTDEIFPSEAIVTPIDEDNWSFVPREFPHVAFNTYVEQGTNVELQTLASVERELLNESVEGLSQIDFIADCASSNNAERYEINIEVMELDGPTAQNLIETWQFEAWVAVLPAS